MPNPYRDRRGRFSRKGAGSAQVVMVRVAKAQKEGRLARRKQAREFMGKFGLKNKTFGKVATSKATNTFVTRVKRIGATSGNRSKALPKRSAKAARTVMRAPRFRRSR